MKKDIYRTIAVVTGIFMLTVTIMLTTNYFQVRNISPLQTEVMETLKSLNETYGDNTTLQEQIRQLDLLARKAYFVQEEHQKNSYVWGLNLAGNVGHQNALLAGLMTAKDSGDATVSIDADLQDDENVIEEMVDKFLEGKDIVRIPEEPHPDGSRHTHRRHSYHKCEM